MMRNVVMILAFLFSAGTAFSATAINEDSEVRILTVTEGGSRTEIKLNAGESVSNFCLSGCFVTLQGGDRHVLTGSETIVISGGRASVR